MPDPVRWLQEIPALADSSVWKWAFWPALGSLATAGALIFLFLQTRGIDKGLKAESAQRRLDNDARRSQQHFNLTPLFSLVGVPNLHLGGGANDPHTDFWLNLHAEGPGTAYNVLVNLRDPDGHPLGRPQNLGVMRPPDTRSLAFQIVGTELPRQVTFELGYSNMLGDYVKMRHTVRLSAEGSAPTDAPTFTFPWAAIL